VAGGAYVQGWCDDERVHGGGDLDFFLATATIYPILFLAIVVESRLSLTSGYLELAEAVADDATGGERRRWLRIAWLLVFVGIGAGVYGEVATLRALHYGRASWNDFGTAAWGLGVEAGVLGWLVLERALVLVAPRTLRWVTLAVGVLLLASSIYLVFFSGGSWRP
jgi:hypothetical protein